MKIEDIKNTCDMKNDDTKENIRLVSNSPCSASLDLSRVGRIVHAPTDSPLSRSAVGQISPMKKNIPNNIKNNISDNILYNEKLSPKNTEISINDISPNRNISASEETAKFLKDLDMRRETALRQAAENKIAENETALRQAAENETALRQAAENETALRQAAEKETALRQAAENETALRQAAENETALKQAAENETAENKKNKIHQESKTTITDNINHTSVSSMTYETIDKGNQYSLSPKENKNISNNIYQNDENILNNNILDISPNRKENYTPSHIMPNIYDPSPLGGIEYNRFKQNISHSPIQNRNISISHSPIQNINRKLIPRKPIDSPTVIERLPKYVSKIDSTPLDSFTCSSPLGVHTSTSPIGAHTSRSPLGVYTSSSPMRVHAGRSPLGVHTSSSPRGVHASRSPLGVHTGRSPLGVNPTYPTSPSILYPNLPIGGDRDIKTVRNLRENDRNMRENDMLKKCPDLSPSTNPAQYLQKNYISDEYRAHSSPPTLLTNIISEINKIPPRHRAASDCISPVRNRATSDCISQVRNNVLCDISRQPPYLSPSRPVYSDVSPSSKDVLSRPVYNDLSDERNNEKIYTKIRINLKGQLQNR
eukprot:GHVL01040783.1.p1 GENE.GHVL01040783.1~~GHVL01040783.1.p1  ORF type:complete len:658 (+),score=235.16 GHVL01040783.1:169-1974(+)